MKLEFVLACLMNLAPQAPPDRIESLAPAIASVSKTKWDAVILSTTAVYETGGTLDCSKRGKAGERSCFQIFARFPEEYDYLKDNYYAASVALEMLHESWQRCRKELEPNRFAAYLSGRCIPLSESRNRYWAVKRLMKEITVSFEDES